MTKRTTSNPNKENKKKTRNRTARLRRMEPTKCRTGEWFERLVEVQARLRAEGGCPWDREQTHQTLRTYLIEEAYEVLEALEAGDDKKFSEELGDLLLQIVFHSQIAREEKRFEVQDVIREIHDKMVRRHPHVFGAVKAKSSAEVLKNWEQLKAEERKAQGKAESEKKESLLDGISRALPATLEAFQLTRRAARIGFDWEKAEDVIDKVAEESAELRREIADGLPEHVEEEMGDLLFAVVNVARFLHVDPEIALKAANAKFSRRFRVMEERARQSGRRLADVPREEMERYWDDAKAEAGAGGARRVTRESGEKSYAGVASNATPKKGASR